MGMAKADAGIIDISALKPKLILSLQPGRATDAYTHLAIHPDHKIVSMNWPCATDAGEITPVFDLSEARDDFPRHPIYIDGDGKWPPTLMDFGDEISFNVHHAAVTPYYSTDILAAMDGLDELDELYHVDHPVETAPVYRITIGKRDYVFRAESLPLAICHAVLMWRVER